MLARQVSICRLAIFACCAAMGAYPAAHAAGRQLKLTNMNVDGRATAVLINATGPKCDTTVVVDLPRSGKVDLSKSVSPGCWSCGDAFAGLSVHARDRAVEYRSASQICEKSVLNVRLRPRTVLVLHIWPLSEEFGKKALDDIVNTDWLLDRNLAGITLKPVIELSSEKIKDFDCLINLPPKELTSQGAGLDVFYGSKPNQSCRERAGRPTFILIHDVPVLGDIAHELGHSLGLNDRDHQFNYSGGHTTAIPGFDCSNALWQQTDALTDHYSTGQAFWLHLSGSSAFARRMARTAPCSDSPDSMSPCPPYSAMRKEQRSQCEPCNLTLTDARRIRAEPNATPTPRSMQICSPGELLAALTARHRTLTEHVRRNPHLKLGSCGRNDFIRRWRSFHGILEIEAVGRTPAGSNERSAGLEHLENEHKQGEFKGSDYLQYAADKIRFGAYVPRYESRIARAALVVPLELRGFGGGSWSPAAIELESLFGVSCLALRARVLWSSILLRP